MATAFAVFCATDGSLTFYNRDTVPTAGSTFEGKVASNVYTGFDTAKYAYNDQVPWYNEKKSIITASFTPEFSTVKPISTSHWFNEATNMTTFNGTNLDTSNVTEMKYMFGRCLSLTSLDLSSFNTSNVTNMYYMFAYCRALTSLDLINFDTSKVTNMGYMFHDTLLKSLDLRSFNTSNVTTMSHMFMSCNDLIHIYVSDTWITSSVTSSEKMFYLCNNLLGAISYNANKIDVTYANYTDGYLTYKFFANYLKDNFIVNGDDVIRVADAIRTKGNTTDGLMFPDGFIDAITSIQQGRKMIWGTFTPDADTKTYDVTHAFGTIPSFGCWALSVGGSQAFAKYEALFGIAFRDITMQALGYCSSESAGTRAPSTTSKVSVDRAMTYTVAGNDYSFVNATTTTITLCTGSSSRMFRAGKTYQYILLGD